jgi:hypothetical protein
MVIEDIRKQSRVVGSAVSDHVGNICMKHMITIQPELMIKTREGKKRGENCV